MSEVLLDAVGTPLISGQRVAYASTGLYSLHALQLGTVVKAYRSPFGGSDTVQIRRDDGKHIVLRWARRVIVITQPEETEADVWLRRQLETLGR